MGVARVRDRGLGVVILAVLVVLAGCSTPLDSLGANPDTLSYTLTGSSLVTGVEAMEEENHLTVCVDDNRNPAIDLEKGVMASKIVLAENVTAEHGVDRVRLVHRGRAYRTLNLEQGEWVTQPACIPPGSTKIVLLNGQDRTVATATVEASR